MKAKTISFIFVAFLLVLASVSAFTLSSPSNDISVSKNTATVNVVSSSSDPNQTISFTLANIADGSNTITFDSLSSIQLNTSETKQITVRANSISSGFNFGKYSTILNASNGTSSATSTISYTKSFCKDGIAGKNLSISNIDISTDGSDDEKWKALDTITVEVKIENDGNDDVKDVEVELGLFDANGKNVINDVDFINSDEEQISIGRINDGDSEKVTFEFKVPADLETGSYKLAVKTYSDDTGESNECADTSSDLNNKIFQDIDVESEDDEGKFIAFDNIEFAPEEAVCSDYVTMKVTAYNIGDNDEDRVKITVYNKELGIDLSQELKSGLDQGDSQEISFNFQIPATAAQKTFTIVLGAEYDYRNGVYRESLDDDFETPLKVLGCSSTGTGTNTGTGSTGTNSGISLTSSLDSTPKAGAQLMVSSTVTNTGNDKANFVINVQGYDDWATLDSVSSRILSLNAGESKEVTIKLTADNDVKGTQTLTVEALSGDKKESSDVDVKFASSTMPSFNLSSNWLIWVIGAINLLLIIIIIIVAVRVSRR